MLLLCNGRREKSEREFRRIEILLSFEGFVEMKES
jgi:hypothetical protein